MKVESITVGSGKKFASMRRPAVPKLFNDTSIVCRSATEVDFENEHLAFAIESDKSTIRKLTRLFNSSSDSTKPGISRDLPLAEILYKLICQGLIFDRAEPISWDYCSGLNAVALIAREIDACEKEISKNNRGLNLILDGTATKKQIQGWILENFHFTRLADYHISPVLLHEQTLEEYQSWKSLLDDEITHWKIYKRLFTELGWDIEAAKCKEPLPSTLNFINCLKAASENNRYSYAAMLSFVERPPSSESIDDDPLYNGLITTYNFSRTAILPLWKHSCLNEVLNHDSLGANVISSKTFFSKGELTELKNSVREIVRATVKWYEGIMNVYSDNKQ
jgi:hypothetical protein